MLFANPGNTPSSRNRNITTTKPISKLCNMEHFSIIKIYTDSIKVNISDKRQKFKNKISAAYARARAQTINDSKSLK